MLALKDKMLARIIREAMPRDISQPRAIVDMNRVRNPWGWGSSGQPGYGGGGDSGAGCW